MRQRLGKTCYNPKYYLDNEKKCEGCDDMVLCEKMNTQRKTEIVKNGGEEMKKDNTTAVKTVKVRTGCKIRLGESLIGKLFKVGEEVEVTVHEDKVVITRLKK